MSREKAEDEEYVPFIIEDYLSNPVAVARIKANLAQKERADILSFSHAYLSKVESRTKVSAKTLEKVTHPLVPYLKGTN
jgi:hypothetical protein